MNILKKSKLIEDISVFLRENNFKEKEIQDCIDTINWSKKQSEHFQLEDILDEFNISHIRHSKGADLSGGERRRVEIARAVANKPSFLLLDEPFAGIDPIAVAGIKSMIDLLKNRNIGVLITDHNVRETLKIIDRGYILSDGKVLVEGTKEELANSEVARKHYLGEDFSLD
ncbi:MAG: ATP-binding cassette domain-containing protein [Cyanobacteriota bacterium]